jgi:hypothetical protein
VSRRAGCPAPDLTPERTMKTKSGKKNATIAPKSTPAESPQEGTTPAEPATTVKNRKQKKDAKAPANPGAKNDERTSALDAAQRVLAASREPLTCKELIEKMQAQGLWQTTRGKTPEATLSASLHREIKLKGGASRFAKAARGKFTLSASPK